MYVYIPFTYCLCGIFGSLTFNHKLISYGVGRLFLVFHIICEIVCDFFFWMCQTKMFDHFTFVWCTESFIMQQANIPKRLALVTFDYVTFLNILMKRNIDVNSWCFFWSKNYTCSILDECSMLSVMISWSVLFQLCANWLEKKNW